VSATTLHDAPGPAPLPGLGALPRLLAFGRDPIGTAGRLFARYGRLTTVVRAPARMVSPGGRGIVIATGADINREVLTAHERYHAYALPGVFYPEEDVTPRTRPITRTLTGLFHVNGDEHRRHRRLLMPAFHKTRIDAYRDDMVRLTERALGEWRAGERRDVLEDMTRLTLAIATTTLFGEDVGARGVELAKRMQEWLVAMFSWGMLLRLDLPRTTYRRWLDLTHEIDARTAALLADKRRRSGDGVGRDMLSMLVAARDEDGSALDEDELVGHTGVIFAAGHETSTNALAWTLLLLASHPDVAADLSDELRGVLKGEAPTIEQLGKLPLLDAVVKESMRLLPPVPLHPRIVAEDHELAGVFLPRRTELFLSIFHMHHDPALFERPRRFLPSRWSRIKPTTFEYNPFSAGPRMCIGAAFATIEIKIVLAMLLQRFRVELAGGTRIDRRVAITMAPKHGLPMIVRPADGAWRSGRRSFRGDIRDLVELPS
jgi:cytochrome P450